MPASPDSSASWAQLRAGPSIRTGLERGRWYPIQAGEADGFIHVRGPDGSDVPLRPELARVIHRQPDSVTRVQQTAFHPVKPGQTAPTLTFYGVCPEGHWIREIGAVETDVRCGTCVRTYRVEDEEHA
jgi:hypothetical protein